MANWKVLLVWLVLLLISLGAWAGIFVAGRWLVQAYVTWPIVRGAMCIGLIGFVLFMVSEQVREIYAIARERKAQERMR